MLFIKKIKDFIVKNKLLGYDKNEKNFINFLKKNKIKKNKIKKNSILVNGYFEYYSLIFTFLLKKEEKFKDYDIIIYRPLFKFSKYSNVKINLFFIINFYKNILISLISNWKWNYLYSLIAPQYISLINFNLFLEVSYLKRAEKILLSYDSKKKIKKLYYKNILIGDLVYDTYLRFSGKPTLNIKDPFLIEILSKTIQLYDYLKKTQNNNNIKYFFSSQRAYIHHGIPFRFFQKTKVISYHFDSTFEYLRKQINNKKFLGRDYRSFPKLFSKIKNKVNKLKEAEQLLKNKFKGKIIRQEKWMPLSVYHNKPLNIDKKINAVIFLHCFVDSPTSRGDTVFIDFYDWIIKTINFFQKYNLEDTVVIKPHPASQADSKIFENILKKKYNKFIWVDSDVSNSSIFKLKPKCGISVHGTVLHELAYHDITPVSAGTNPTIAYSFVKSAKNIKEYFDIIKKIIFTNKIEKINKKELLEFTYCYYIMDNTNINLIAKKMNLKNFIVDENSSSSLDIFEKLYKK